MIARERLTNKLENLGMRCSNPGQLIGLFKGRVRGVDRIATVNIAHDFLEELTVRSTLNRVGCDIDEIEDFVANNRAVAS